MQTAHVRRRALLLYVGGAVILAAGGYLSFELGRYEAGYSLLDERRQIEQFQAAIAERDATIEELRREQAILETSVEIDRETYAQVENTLSRLEARIQAQEEELAFYRGIVAPEDGVPGLRIQDLELRPADAEQRRRLRLVLVQAIVHSKPVSGRVRVRLAGSLDGEATELGLEQLAGDGQPADMTYEFRYFQSLERELVLPPGFEPAVVEVEIQPDGARADPVLERFEWSAVSG